MLKKTPLILLTAGLVTALAIFLSGCSTEEPWNPNPSRSLEISLVSAPDTSTVIPNGSNVTFNWISKGGSGTVSGYQWYLAPVETGFGSNSMVTSVTYESLAGAAGGSNYQFYVRVTDSANNTAMDSTSFAVADTVFPPPDNTAPTIEITMAPVEGSYVATGTAVDFAWMGDDGHGLEDTLLYQYAFPTMADSSGWLAATTVTYVNVAAADPATFYVRCRDQAMNNSDWDSVSFIIKDATILYVDDYLWLDSYGDVDRAKERDQKQFYRDALEGYAFAEWDIAVQGFPDSSDLVTVGGEPVYSTVLFGSDGDCDDGTWWYDVGEPGGGPLRYYMESGGDLIAIGSEILPWIYNSQPPLPGDFEYDWFGILDTLVVTYDSTFWLDDESFCCHVDGADSVTVDTSMSTWDYWGDFTWAVNAGQFAGLPDSMKIDAAKVGLGENGIASNTPGLRDGAVVLYKWGFDVDGSCCVYEYGEPIAHVFYVGGVARSAMLNFDGYRMGLPDLRQTIDAILVEFGE